MFFFFKRPTTTLDCFTYRNEVYNWYPIVKGSEALPNWWKKLPRSKFNWSKMEEGTTMKSCPGFIEFHRNSACIRLWTDIAIKQDGYHGIVDIKAADAKTQVDEHQNTQYQGFVDGTFQHIKIIVPWVMSCKDDINWVYVGNPWQENLNNELTILPGLLNFKYQTTCHINGFLKNEKNTVKAKLLNVGTPMVNLFPMSDKKIIIKNHLVTLEEYVRQDRMAKVSFSRAYYKAKKAMDELENSPSCPFSRIVRK